MFGDFFRNRPITSIVLGIGTLLVLIWAFAARAIGGSSDAGAITAAGPSPDAQLAAATQISLAQIAASADTQARSDEVALRTAEIAVSQRLGELGYQTDNNLATLQYNLATTGLATNAQIDLAQIASQDHQYNIAAHVRETELQTTADLQKRLIDANVQQTQIHANSANYAAKQQSSQKKTSGILGVVGGIIGGLFSDIRLKENVTLVGTDRNGMAWYTFEYTDEAQQLLGLPSSQTLGMMAQELESFAPECVTLDESGFYKVDYNRYLRERCHVYNQ